MKILHCPNSSLSFHITTPYDQTDKIPLTMVMKYSRMKGGQGVVAQLASYTERETHERSYQFSGGVFGPFV